MIKMTIKDAIKHLSYKISYANICNEDWADAVSVYALTIAVCAMERRKKGEWFKRGVSLYKCSECDRFSTTQENFCPSCGADMRY